MLNDVVHRAGNLPAIPDIEPKTILEAVKFDKKAVDGTLHWILLKGIGKPTIVLDKDIPRVALTKAVRKILKK